MNLQEFVDGHVRLLAEGDAARLVDHDYHDQAAMILMIGGEPLYIQGKDALKAQFGYYLEHIYRGLVSIESMGMLEDAICLEATIATASGPARVWDALYLKDGKIFRHFSGLR